MAPNRLNAAGTRHDDRATGRVDRTGDRSRRRSHSCRYERSRASLADVDMRGLAEVALSIRHPKLRGKWNSAKDSRGMGGA
jgi:hypothetical protein